MGMYNSVYTSVELLVVKVLHVNSVANPPRHVSKNFVSIRLFRRQSFL